jgi:hypothetical protein
MNLAREVCLVVCQDEFPIPCWDFPRHFIFKVLKVRTSKAPHREGQHKIFEGGRSSFHRHPIEDAVKVDVGTTNRSLIDLLKIGAKVCDLAKSNKNGRKILDAFLVGSNRESHIIHIYCEFLKIGSCP